jgi:hypothetical protein
LEIIENANSVLKGEAVQWNTFGVSTLAKTVERSCWCSANALITTREVLINDALLSSRKTPKSSPKVFYDELVTKIVSSWNERH